MDEQTQYRINANFRRYFQDKKGKAKAGAGGVPQAVEKQGRFNTVVSIAHRLSSFRGADKLIVLQHGKKVEEGPPEELLKNAKGVYARMHRLFYSTAVSLCGRKN